MEHRVSIGRLDTRVRSIGTPVHADATMGEIFTSGLSALLPELLDPLLDAHDGVIRIRTLQLDVPARGFTDANRLAALLAEAIAQAVGQALSGATASIMAWPTRPEYLAHYVQYRLGLRRLPAWCFEEFTALEHLSPVQALVQLAGDEPALVRALAVDDPHAAVLGRLDAQDCRELLGRLLQTPGAQPVLPHLTAAHLTARVRNTAPGLLARHTLQLLFAACARQPAGQAAMPVALLPGIMAVVALAALLEQDPAATGQRVPHPADLFDRQLRRVAALPPAYRTALRQAGAHPVLRQLLQRQLRLVNDPPETARPNREPEGTRRQGPEPPALRSPWAGCALLLPVLRAHGIDQVLDAGQLHQAVLETLDPADRQSAGRDPLLSRLFHPDPSRPLPDWPPVPARLSGELHPESRALAFTRGAGGWSGLLLSLFASRLPGLRGSSAGYLRRQFLAVPGTLTETGTGLRVELDGPALAVVLSMAGLSGPQPPLPWLDGLGFTLVLRGLRP